jgi:hypothetical protein
VCLQHIFVGFFAQHTLPGRELLDVHNSVNPTLPARGGAGSLPARGGAGSHHAPCVLVALQLLCLACFGSSSIIPVAAFVWFYYPAALSGSLNCSMPCPLAYHVSCCKLLLAFCRRNIELVAASLPGVELNVGSHATGRQQGHCTTGVGLMVVMCAGPGPAHLLARVCRLSSVRSGAGVCSTCSLCCCSWGPWCVVCAARHLLAAEKPVSACTCHLKVC